MLHFAAAAADDDDDDDVGKLVISQWSMGILLLSIIDLCSVMSVGIGALVACFWSSIIHTLLRCQNASA